MLSGQRLFGPGNMGSRKESQACTGKNLWMLPFHGNSQKIGGFMRNMPYKRMLASQSVVELPSHLRKRMAGFRKVLLTHPLLHSKRKAGALIGHSRHHGSRDSNTKLPQASFLSNLWPGPKRVNVKRRSHPYLKIFLR